MEWGAEIKVDGVRPDWLRNGERWRLTTSLGGKCVLFGGGQAWQPVWAEITAIRLPADHAYYTATEAGFTYWPGGGEAPSDWDKGSVLFRGGDVVPADAVGHLRWWHRTDNSDIIGYYKRTVAPSPSAPETLQPGTYIASHKRNPGENHHVEVVSITANGVFAKGPVYRINDYDWEPVSPPNVPPRATELTITITGPQGSGKTRWADLIRGLPAEMLGFPKPVVVDGSAS